MPAGKKKAMPKKVVKKPTKKAMPKKTPKSGGYGA